MEEKYYVEPVKLAYSNVPKAPYNPLKRPEIHYKKFVISIVGFLLLLAVSAIAGMKLFENSERQVLCTVVMCMIASGIYMMVIAKRAVIWIVHFYQNKASDEVRLQCVFEPSCSEYMILAVEKYGVIKGVIKGINRLRRCHGPNCGVDYP